MTTKKDEELYVGVDVSKDTLDVARQGLTRQQFARYYLMRLGIGSELEKIMLNPKYPRRLASEAEVLALRPELRQIE